MNTLHASKLRWVVFHGLASVVIGAWIQAITETGRWPSGDGPHILGTSARLAQLLIDGDWSLFIHCFSSLLGPHPPFAYLLHTIGALVGGTHPSTHLIGGGLTMLLCFNAFYRLKVPIIGFLWVCSLSPIWLQAESAGIDLIAGAVVLQSVSWLAVSKRLSAFTPACAWGLWMGVAFMTKYTAPMFLIGPCLIAGYWVLRFHRWKRLAQAFGSFCLVAMPWWSTHYKQVLGYVSMAGNSESGLLTNKAIIESPWYAFENISWYPAALADAIGWSGFLVIVLASILSLFLRRSRPLNTVLLSSFFVGWLVLNAQSQRQDRYVIPAYFPAAALLSLSPINIPTAIIPILLLQETHRIYTSDLPAPAERNYKHSIEDAGQSFPVPSLAYHPTAQDPKPWKVDDALIKLREYHGSDDGTVGFLLDERNGAPGYGMILSRATAMGYRWHIATVVMPQPGHRVSTEKNRPTASIFVGPFWLGNWPSKEFSVLLSILEENPNPKVKQWLRETHFKPIEKWDLPHNRVGIIYQKQTTE